MEAAAEIIQRAIDQKRTLLSEYESKQVAAAYGIPCVEELLVEAAAAPEAAARLGYPVALKACAPHLPHKSDQGLLRLNLGSAGAVEAAATEIRAALGDTPIDGFLTQRMVRGKREIIAGALRDPIFGPCVMLGIGGIGVEAHRDVVFRLAPIEERDALEMIEELRGRRIFEEFRGEPAADRPALAALLCALGRLLIKAPGIAQVDLNPIILEEGRPLAVDALIALAEPSEAAPAAAEHHPPDRARFQALFEPASVAIIGATGNPGKWGFRIFFNTLEGAYTGRLYPVNPNHQEVLGVPSYPSVADLPEAVDLALIVVPPAAVPGELRACAVKGVRAVLVITAGFGELGEAHARAAQDEIAQIARETGLLLAGPNCAGVVSTEPYRLYCGMISRFPGPGGLSVVSQSGNVGSTVLTWAGLHQVGVARFISTGNEAATRTEDYLEFLGQDERTHAVISYIEGTRNGRRLFDKLRMTAQRKPVILVKGGRSQEGMRAAHSHTGALAAETPLFEAVCRQAGATVVHDFYEAIEAGAVLGRQPLPRGRRVVIVSQGGGWGVIGADACADAGLDLVPLDEELMRELDGILPAWWSRNNPIDLVASTEIDALSRTIECVIKSPDVDAVILLGVGYISCASNRYQQSDLAKGIGLDQLAAMGSELELQDIRRIAGFVETYGKPILIASDTVLIAYGPMLNRVIHEIEGLGFYAFSNPNSAARVLAHMADRFEFLENRPRRACNHTP
jgi:acyl-CoA synthetase (NDP forming)